MKWELWILMRIAIAGILAGIVGLERWRSGKPAGIRTHMLVAVGATLYLSYYDLFRADAERRGEANSFETILDPGRAIQAIAVGIGFLGAGMIFISEASERVQGLTTAASIWVTAALGIAVALDRYLLAVGCTGLMWIILHQLERFEAKNEQLVDERSSPEQ